MVIVELLSVMIASLVIVGGALCLFATDVVWELLRINSQGSGKIHERSDELELELRGLGLAGLIFGCVLLWALLSGTIGL